VVCLLLFLSHVLLFCKMSNAFLVDVTQKEPSIERAVFASFTDANSINVIAIRPSGLDIFALVGGGENEKPGKLVLETRVYLYGSVRDVAVIRFAGAEKDALIVSFASAKCTICEWNNETGELQTVSMHFFETEALKMGFTRFHLPPKLSVDPANRCAAMIVLDRHIAIIPVAQELQTGDAISALYGLAQAKRAKTQASWVIGVSDISTSKTCQLIDMAFLHDYFQPTILVLTEDRPTWSGRALVVWNTRTVTAISLDVQNRKWSTIWTVAGLSNDVHSLWPVPSPVGGAVLLAANAVYYVNQTTRYAMAVNIHGTVNPSFPRMALWKSSSGIVLDAARLCFVAVTSRYASCLISDKQGILYVMNLMVGGTSVDSMEIASIGASSVASNLSYRAGHVFLASRLGDSLLLKCDDAKTKSAHQMADTAAPSAIKRPRAEKEEDILFEQLFSAQPGDGDVVGEGLSEAVPLDGNAPDERDREDLREAAREARAEASAREAKMVSRNAESQATVVWSLSVEDTVLSVPITSMVLTPSLDAASLSNAEELEGDNARHLLDVVACSGKGKSSCLAVMQQSARPDLFLSFPMGFVNAAWALYHGSESPFHQYLVLSRRRSTTLLSTVSQELHDVEPEGCAMILDAPTVGVWSFAGPGGEAHSRMIQVTKHEVRLCAGPMQPVQIVDTRLTDVLSSFVVSASFAGGLLVVLRYNGEISSWKYDQARDLLVALPAIDERDIDAPWASCYVYVHASSAHTSWQVLNEDQLTMNTLMREMREQGKSEAEIEEMLGGSLADLTAANSGSGQDANQDWTFVVASKLSGSVEMWLLEGGTFRLVFWTMGFCKGESLVTHEQRWQAAMTGGLSMDEEAKKRGTLFVQEICIYRSEDRGLPMIFCLTSQNELLAYKSVHTGADGHVLALRFRRMPLNFVTRAYQDVSVASRSVFSKEDKEDKEKEQADEERDGMDLETKEQDVLPYSRQLIVFNNLSGRRGIFFRGLHRSGWCFFTSGEFPNAIVHHNVYGEGAGLNAFTPFHYESCRRGFITINADGKLRIAQLRLGSAPGCNGEVDGSWIVRKVSVRSDEDRQEGYDVTPMAVDYHPPSQHIVVSSMATREREVTPSHSDSAVGLRLPVLEERWRLSLHRAGSLKQSAMLWMEV
jgi:hypothetical protein